jgi:hypothetical protein
MVNKSFTIGTDIEKFVVDEEGNSVSVEGKLGGSKKEPLDIGQGCNRQEDCVLAEFGIPPVMYGEVDKFVNYLEYCNHVGNKILNPQGLYLLSGSSRHFSAKELATEQAMTFGCDPSWNVYTQNTSVIPDPEDVGSLRSAGFHIHIGFPANFYKNEYDYIQATEKIIKLMDLNLGVPSIIMDMDTERRQIYGKPGDFRFRYVTKDVFVLEYRSLGGGLLGCKESIQYVFNQTCKVIDDFLQGIEVPQKMEQEIQDCMLNNNLELARQILTEMNVAMPKVRVLEENVVYEN